MELAESSYTIIQDITTLDYVDESKGIGLKTIPSASLNATIYGVPKMFIPRWLQTTNISAKSLLDKQQLPWNWTYI
jgi:NTE family protein